MLENHVSYMDAVLLLNSIKTVKNLRARECISFCVKNAYTWAIHFTSTCVASPVDRSEDSWLKRHVTRNGHDFTHFVLLRAPINHSISIEAGASVRCHAHSARLARNFATWHARLLLFVEPVTFRAVADTWRDARTISAWFLADWLAFASHRRVTLAEFVAAVA